MTDAVVTGLSPEALPDLPAHRMAEAFRAGRLDPLGYARALCERNRALNPALDVWAWFDEDAFLRAAAGAGAGPLAGIPVAIKDIIATADMPTGFGSPVYAGNRPGKDAALVALIRAAGGLVMGKTVTTEFAYATPGPTRNPHDPTRTPGGSSSGSAAAVAAGIVPMAVGTQTAGSVIRPAAFCGVVGYKPSFGRIARAGVLSFSESLDTVGTFARDLGDAWLLADVMAGNPEPTPLVASVRPPRVGVCETSEWGQAAAETRQAIAGVAEALRIGGADVRAVGYPVSSSDLQRIHLGIMAHEAARALAHESRSCADLLSPRLGVLLAEGRAISSEAHGQMLDAVETAKRDWAGIFAEFDVLLTASAPGEAPPGLDQTGDPVFNRVWTLLGGPCVHLPTSRGPNGMPVGVQLVGPLRRDLAFMRSVRWIADSLRLPV